MFIARNESLSLFQMLSLRFAVFASKLMMCYCSLLLPGKKQEQGGPRQHESSSILEIILNSAQSFWYGMCEGEANPVVCG